MIQKQSFGEPFIETHFIDNEQSVPAAGRCLVMNLDKEQCVTVEGEFAIPPMSAAIVLDAELSVPGKALMICNAGLLDLNDLMLLDCMRAAWKSNYQLSGLPQHRGVPYYKSPKLTLGGVSMNFVLVAEPNCPSGIHREHARPVSELHLQVAGTGAVDLLRSADPNTVYASLPLAEGAVHVPEWNAQGVYPWHRYRSVTRSVFLAIEI